MVDRANSAPSLIFTALSFWGIENSLQDLRSGLDSAIRLLNMLQKITVKISLLQTLLNEAVESVPHEVIMRYYLNGLR